MEISKDIRRQATPEPRLRIGARLSRLSDLHIFIGIFLVVWTAAVFFGPGGSSGNANTVSHVAPIFTLVEHGSLRIDEFAALTIDKASLEGHAYSDKAPGQMLAAFPAVWALIALAHASGYSTTPLVGDEFTPFYRVAVWVAVAATSAPFAALGAACLYRLARHLKASRGGALFASLSLGLATPMLGWASVLFSHAMAGGALFVAFTLVILGSEPDSGTRAPWRCGIAAGAALGTAISTEYTALLPGLIIGLMGLARLRLLARPRALALIGGALLGGLPFALALGAYNSAAFGSPIHLGYSSVEGFDGMKQGFFGVSAPSLVVLGEIVGSPRRGVLWLAPELIAVPLAMRAALRIWPLEIIGAVMAIVAAYLLLNASYYYWDGGWSTGPRHIVASLPFACLPLAALWDCASTRMRQLYLAASGLGAALSVSSAAVDMTAPGFVDFPIRQYLLPLFIRGRVHNFPAALGLNGYLSMLVLPLVLGGVVAAIASLAWWESRGGRVGWRDQTEPSAEK
jgi:hypothetical protein